MQQRTFNLSQTFKFRFKARLIYFILGLKFKRNQYNEIVKRQIKKGYDKYNRTILECPLKAYNWPSMAIEEVIDALYYADKNNQVTVEDIKTEKLLSYYDVENIIREWSKEKNGTGLIYKNLHDQIQITYQSNKHFK